MGKFTAFCHSELGRRLGAILLVVLGALVQNGTIPLDYVIPGTVATTGQLLGILGVGVAATSGSASRPWTPPA